MEDQTSQKRQADLSLSSSFPLLLNFFLSRHTSLVRLCKVSLAALVTLVRDVFGVDVVTLRRLDEPLADLNKGAAGRHEPLGGLLRARG